jgi:hypothetical protein
MIKDADRVLNASAGVLSGPGKKKQPYALTPPTQRAWDHCRARLEGARIAFDGAEQAGDALAQRDAYVKAGFQAGQALSCVRTAKIGTKMGVEPIVKPPPKKKPKAPSPDEEE